MLCLVCFCYSVRIYNSGQIQAIKSNLEPTKILVLFHTPSEGEVFEPGIEKISEEALKYLEICAVKDDKNFLSIYVPNVGERDFKITSESPQELANTILSGIIELLERDQRKRKSRKDPEVARLKGGIREVSRHLRTLVQSEKRRKTDLAKFEELKTEYLEHVKPEKRKNKEKKINKKTTIHSRKPHVVVEKNDTPKEKERFEWKQRLAAMKNARAEVRPSYLARQLKRAKEQIMGLSKQVFLKSLAEKLTNTFRPIGRFLPEWLRHPPGITEEL